MNSTNHTHTHGGLNIVTKETRPTDAFACFDFDVKLVCKNYFVVKKKKKYFQDANYIFA